MTDQEFKKYFKRSSVKMIIVGGVVFALGLLMIWGLIADVDKTAGTGAKIGMCFLIALFLLTGGAIVFVPLRSDFKVRKGEHSLINAIDRNDPDFVLWYYPYITKVEGGGSNHQVWIHCADGKRYFLAMKAKRVSLVMEYLGTKFPRALAGFSEVNKDFYERKISGQRSS